MCHKMTKKLMLNGKRDYNRILNTLTFKSFIFFVEVPHFLSALQQNSAFISLPLVPHALVCIAADQTKAFWSTC